VCVRDQAVSGVLTVWRDPANDVVSLLNGHHRLALAPSRPGGAPQRSQRQGFPGQDPDKTRSGV
jgi:hypothetical protein